MKKSKLAALTGLLSALSVVLMFLGSVISVLSYIMPLISGLLMIIIGNYSQKYSWIMFFVVSIISVFSLPDKECALTYLFFFGYYPIIKYKIDAVRSKLLCWIIKLLIFNTGIIASQFICFYVFGIPFDDVFGKWGIVILLLLANVVFAVYERMFYSLSVIYSRKYKKYVDKLLK